MNEAHDTKATVTVLGNLTADVEIEMVITTHRAKLEQKDKTARSVRKPQNGYVRYYVPFFGSYTIHRFQILVSQSLRLPSTHHPPLPEPWPILPQEDPGQTSLQTETQILVVVDAGVAMDHRPLLHLILVVEV